MTLNYVTLTLDLYDGQGNYPVSGTATFTPSAVLTDAGVQVTGQQPVVAVFHAAGSPAVKLLATDNSGPLPTGWTWQVAFSGITGAPAAFSFALPYAGGSTQLLSSQVPVSSGTSFQAYTLLPSVTDSATVYVTADGSDTSNGLSWAAGKATIAGALAALPANGGVVQVGYGTWTVASSSRSDTGVTYNSGTSTWADSSITTGDIGKYVLGGGQQNRVPKITSVSAGVSFQTDVQPPGNISSETVQVVAPAFVLPEGVTILGLGSGFSATNFASGTSLSTSKVVDTGSGVTFLVRGASNPGLTSQAARYRLADLSVWGLASGTPGTNFGSTFCGLYVGNNANWCVVDRCDFQFHGQAAIITDSNMNMLDVRDANIANNGTPTATTPGGGVIVAYYNNTASAGNSFDNCYFMQNYGCGIGWYIAGQGAGAFAVNLRDCQFISTFASDWATYNGYGAILQTGPFGTAKVDGCWFESGANGDLWVDGTGGVNCFSSVFKSTAAATVYGILNLAGCYFYQSSGEAISNNGTVNWMGCTTAGAGLYTGGPSAAQLKGAGSSAGLTATALASGNGPAAGGHIYSGSGAPNISASVAGDYYFRTDATGTSDERLYVATGANTWSGILCSEQPETGSWWGLHSVYEQQRSEFEAFVSSPPLACPNDGEPLRYAPSTGSSTGIERYCPYCAWAYPKDYIAPQRPWPGTV